LRIAGFKLESSAEVKDHFSDIVYFQGCSRHCSYCFNPELIPFDAGYDIKISEIISSLSDFSDVVVLTGGEPLEQEMNCLFNLISHLRQKTTKKVVLETAVITIYDYLIYKLCHKVLLTLKTFDPPKKKHFEIINGGDTIIPCVVIGHPWFDWHGFKKILRRIKKPLYFRHYNGIPKDFTKIYRLAKSYKVQLRKFDRICL